MGDNHIGLDRACFESGAVALADRMAFRLENTAEYADNYGSYIGMNSSPLGIRDACLSTFF